MKKVLTGILAGLFLTVFSVLWAQEQQPQPGGPPPLPKFGPELDRLSFLAGNFSTANVAYPSPMSPGGPGKGRNMNRWELDSLFLVFNYEANITGMGTYKAKGMFTYDGQERAYKLWWFDTFGGGHQYKGAFTGDTLILEGDVPMPGGTLKEKIMWHPEGKKFKFRMLQDWGEGFKLSMEETATPSGATGRRKK